MTVVESIGVVFKEHPSFSKEINRFNNKYDGGNGFRHLKKLLIIHFHPTKRQLRFTPKILRKISGLGLNIDVYKVIMRIKGLRSNQSPRICFRHTGNMITFLCSGSHIDNYKDSKLKKLIKKRVEELDSCMMAG